MMHTLASSWGNVTMKCSVSLALSSETSRASFVVGRRLDGPRPTGYSPVAACFTLQTITSIRLVSWRSSSANNWQTTTQLQTTQEITMEITDNYNDNGHTKAICDINSFYLFCCNNNNTINLRTNNKPYPPLQVQAPPVTDQSCTPSPSACHWCPTGCQPDRIHAHAAVGKIIEQQVCITNHEISTIVLFSTILTFSISTL